ncbi:MAG: cyclic nucleotide-binding domain-containing protein [Helicobacteraceae bacterium]|nr:cyclic nucleotide-binding domain-containing protein [Helicobacteraceae bacterium]
MAGQVKKVAYETVSTKFDACVAQVVKDGKIIIYKDKQPFMYFYGYNSLRELIASKNDQIKDLKTEVITSKNQAEAFKAEVEECKSVNSVRVVEAGTKQGEAGGVRIVEASTKKDLPGGGVRVMEASTKQESAGGVRVINNGSGANEALANITYGNNMGLEEDNIPVQKPSLTIGQETLIQFKNILGFFDNIENDDLIRLVGDVTIMKLKKDERIFLQGETSEEIFFIISGRVNVTISNVQQDELKTVATLEKGAVFGEMAFITKEPRSAGTMSASNNTNILKFRIDDECDPSDEGTLRRIFQNFAIILSQRVDKHNKKTDKKK